MKRASIAAQEGGVGITVGQELVSGVFMMPANARAALVLAHGAGAGMDHAFLASLANGLAQRSIGTMRFQFPYMERGERRTDAPGIATAAVRAAVVEAARRFAGLPLFAGGKSFGGRMTSTAQAESPLPGVKGLVFFGFPLHPAGMPSLKRAAHLGDVSCPMLFLQGTRDALADTGLLQQVVQQLGRLATVRWFDQADHSFDVLKRSGRTDEQIMQELLDQAAAWMLRIVGVSGQD